MKKKFSVLLSVCTVMGLLLLCSSSYALTLTGSFPNKSEGESYNLLDGGLKATGVRGFRQEWTVTDGSLPPGLSLHPFLSSECWLDGTATRAGTYQFTVMLRDYELELLGSATITLTITITPSNTIQDPTIGGTFSSGSPNVPYSSSIYASDGHQPYTWSYDGDIPDGLTLQTEGTNNETYTLSGTPTSEGTFALTVTVKDSYERTATKSLTVTIGNGGGTGGNNPGGNTGGNPGGVTSDDNSGNTGGNTGGNTNGNETNQNGQGQQDGQNNAESNININGSGGCDAGGWIFALILAVAGFFLEPRGKEEI